jgi:hypothetical protein
VATLRAQLENLNGQLVKHKADLDNLDLAPSDGFIAARALHGDKVIAHTNAKVPGLVDRVDLEALAPTARAVDDSPLLKGGKAHAVLQMGPETHGYRLVAALDAEGKIYAMYEEKRVNGHWKQRGAESPYRGKLTEDASHAYDLKMLRKKGMPDDLVITIQNTRNNGFDRVLLKYDISDYAKNAQGKLVLKDDAIPRLTIVEDKSNYLLHLDAFTAFSPDIFAKNIAALKKGQAPPLSGKKGAQATYHQKPGTSAKTPDIPKLIKKAIEAKRVSIEIRSLDESAFRGGSTAKALADSPIAIDLKDSLAKQKIKDIDLKAIEVRGLVLDVKAKGEVGKPFKKYYAERRIGDTFPLYARIVGLTGKPNYSPDFITAAHFLQQFAQASSKSMPKARLLTNADRSPLAIDGVKIISDGTGKSILHIDVKPPSKLLDKMAKSANEILMLMGRNVTDPVAKVSSKPETVLDLTDWKPEQIAKLKTALETAAKGNAAHKKALERISVFPTKSKSIEKLFPPASKKK